MNTENNNNFWQGFKRAFAIEKPTDYKYTEADVALLDIVAAKVKKFGMETPAVLFLETVKPLNYVGSQTMVFFRPIVHSIFSPGEYDHFSRLLEHRSCIEKLIERIEGKEDEDNESR